MRGIRFGSRGALTDGLRSWNGDKETQVRLVGQGEDFSLERMIAQNNQRTILTVCWLCYNLAANVWRPGVEVEGAD